jgi:hypothetical protein
MLQTAFWISGTLQKDLLLAHSSLLANESAIQKHSLRFQKQESPNTLQLPVNVKKESAADDTSLW